MLASFLTRTSTLDIALKNDWLEAGCPDGNGEGIYASLQTQEYFSAVFRPVQEWLERLFSSFSLKQLENPVGELPTEAEELWEGYSQMFRLMSLLVPDADLLHTHNSLVGMWERIQERATAQPPPPPPPTVIGITAKSKLWDEVHEYFGGYMPDSDIAYMQIRLMFQQITRSRRFSQPAQTYNTIYWKSATAHPDAVSTRMGDGFLVHCHVSDFGIRVEPTSIDGSYRTAFGWSEHPRSEVWEFNLNPVVQDSDEAIVLLYKANGCRRSNFWPVSLGNSHYITEERYRQFISEEDAYIRHRQENGDDSEYEDEDESSYDYEDDDY